MKLPIIEYRNDLLRNSLVAILFLGLLYVVAFYGEDRSIYAILAFSTSLSLILSIDSLVFRKTGIFKIESNSCEIDRMPIESFSINYSDITYLIIDHFKYHNSGFAFKSYLILKITIQYQDKEISFKVYQKGEDVKIDLINELKKLYKKGVQVKEYDINGNRCFLFQSNLSYKEIQDIKQEYNISWY